MTVEELIGFGLALVVMCIGLAGTFIPGIPSTGLVLLSATVHRLYFGQASVSNLVLGLLVALTLVSLALDYIASMIGAKKLGATWRGVLGAVVGAMVGMFFSIPGILIGPFLGALAFEMMGGRKFDESARAGVGAFVGVMVGAVGKGAVCVVMIALFTVSTISRS